VSSFMFRRRQPNLRLETCNLKLAARGALILLAAAALRCASAPPAESILDEAVRRAEARCQCRMGVSARHLESGRSFSHNGGSEVEAAPVIKTAGRTEALG